mmetsp:Transcript_18412/g.32619  ORF Transcript_18412/g.32619 Transcript_18412/m.32619 type:complete len:134 (+) Transcript_18412:231-632(+)
MLSSVVRPREVHQQQTHHLGHELLQLVLVIEPLYLHPQLQQRRQQRQRLPDGAVLAQLIPLELHLLQSSEQIVSLRLLHLAPSRPNPEETTCGLVGHPQMMSWGTKEAFLQSFASSQGRKTDLKVLIAISHSI